MSSSRQISQITVLAAILGLMGWAGTIAASGAASLRNVPQDKPTATQVKIDNFSFEPREITIAPGTTITWTNRDDVPHTVTSTDDKFGSKAMDTDDTFTFTFKDAGTYEYYCSVHPKMTGKVIVK